MILLDTHAIVWWTIENQYLSKPAQISIKDEIAKDGIILICAVSFWELAVKERKNKLNIGINVSELFHRLQSLSYVQFSNPDSLLWIESGLLDWKHKDPVDRLLVATAKQKKIALVSSDPEIKKIYKKTIW